MHDGADIKGTPAVVGASASTHAARVIRALAERELEVFVAVFFFHDLFGTTDHLDGAFVHGDTAKVDVAIIGGGGLLVELFKSAEGGIGIFEDFFSFFKCGPCFGSDVSVDRESCVSLKVSHSAFGFGSKVAVDGAGIEAEFFESALECFDVTAFRAFLERDVGRIKAVFGSGGGSGLCWCWLCRWMGRIRFGFFEGSPCFGSDDAVDVFARVSLEGFDRFFSFGSKVAVDGSGIEAELFESALKGFDVLALCAFFESDVGCVKSRFGGGCGGA